MIDCIFDIENQELRLKGKDAQGSEQIIYLSREDCLNLLEYLDSKSDLLSSIDLDAYRDFAYTEWYKNGYMMTRRIYLPVEHPESVPSLFKKRYGVSIIAVLGRDWQECFETAPKQEGTE